MFDLNPTSQEFKCALGWLASYRGQYNGPLEDSLNDDEIEFLDRCAAIVDCYRNARRQCLSERASNKEFS